MQARETNFLREALSKPHAQPRIPILEPTPKSCPTRNPQDCLKIPRSQRCDACLMRPR